MSEQTPNLSIFNIGENAEVLNDAMFDKKFESNLFDPRVKNVGDTTSFIIRPVPYVNDVINSKVRKYFYAVPAGGSFAFFDSATTFNNPAANEWHFCPISDIWLRLTKSADPNVQKMAELVRRQVAIYTYVMIVNYPDDPSLNGKILPMRVPIDLDKAMQTMSQPTEAQIKLGKKGIQPYDIINGCDMTCTIVGHKPRPNDPVMRDWKIEVEKPSPLTVPLGPNGTMVPVNTVPQDQVIEYFKEQQTINLFEQFGFRAPDQQTRLAAYHWLQSVVGMVPGISDAINANFADLKDIIAQEQVGGMGGPGAAPQTQQVSFDAPVPQAPQATEPVPQAPQPTEPVPQAPQPTEPVPQAPQATEPVPQAPQATEPVPQAPQATEPVPQAPAQPQENPIPVPEQAPATQPAQSTSAGINIP